jgi:FKBP-type peptidyl-prolyl cis-trans isomerase FkpA
MSVNRFFSISLLFMVGLSVIFSSCEKTNDNQKTIDDQIISSYLTKNNLNAIKTSSGLYYIISNQGTGKKVNSNDKLYVKYKGYLSDSTVFDENTTGTSISLNSVITGWQEGLTYFNVGGKGKLFIPSHLAYGKNENGKVPANSVLFFDIEVLEIQ